MENLNAEQVKKALECCFAETMRCEECPRYDACREGIAFDIAKCTLAIINSQEQRIGELTEEVAEEKAKGGMCADVIKRQDKEIAKKDAEIKRLRADTIDEFADMVKEKMREVATGKRTSLIGAGWIDEIARELKGE